MTIHAFAHSLCISHVAAELGHMTDRHQCGQYFALPFESISEDKHIITTHWEIA